MTISRCEWCTNDPLYVVYHDLEWGVPSHDERHLFEMLILEGVQAGLSWLTVLKKRDHYRRVFDGFDPEVIARYGQDDIVRLLADPGVIRNRLKLEAAVRNARAFLDIQASEGGFAPYLWGYVEHAPRQNEWRSVAEVPSRTAESERMSRDLKKRGFNFVGPTICYALMQAVGMVNDHTVGCFRHAELRAMAAGKPR